MRYIFHGIVCHWKILWISILFREDWHCQRLHLIYPERPIVFATRYVDSQWQLKHVVFVEACCVCKAVKKLELKAIAFWVCMLCLLKHAVFVKLWKNLSWKLLQFWVCSAKSCMSWDTRLLWSDNLLNLKRIVFVSAVLSTIVVGWLKCSLGLDFLL